MRTNTNILIVVNCTLSLPLNRSWNSSEVQFDVIQKPPQPNYNFKSLWYNETSDSVFTFGGEQSGLDTKAPVDLSTWKLTIDGNGGGDWSQNATFQDPPFSLGITRPFGGASAVNDKYAFYVDGYSSSKSSPMTQGLSDFVPTPGIVTYNLKDGIWSNTTDTREASRHEIFLWSGMESIPFGPNGLIMVFGGESSRPQKYTPGAEMRSMSNISLFDPVTKLWYHQTATSAGDRLPSSRIKFCTVGVGDPTAVNDNNSSYEMSVPHTNQLSASQGANLRLRFMYSGYNGTVGLGAEMYDEIWG